MQSLAKMEVLVNISSDLVRHLDEGEVIRKIVTDASRVVGAASCSVILVDDESGECFFYTAAGQNAELLKKIRFRKELGIAGRALNTCKTVVMGKNSKNPDHYKGVDQQTGMSTESLICVPILVKNRAIGVVEAVNKIGTGDFSDDDTRMLTLFANFAAIALSNAREYGRCRTEVEAFKIAASRDNCCPCESPAMKKVWALVSKVARTGSTVFITGESGSGKEIVASTIHARSDRGEKPFICVNCAALETNLLSSELFGHEKGAFTGAISRRLGRFELARHGTIFLDEIVDADLPVQAMLLRVLENRVFERLGSSEPISTDARVIVATNADPLSAVSSGRFRADLYHRLNVIRIDVPPLRDRKPDIPALFDWFARFFAAELKIEPVKPDKQALKILQNYEWPGNVRELKNLVERSSVLCAGPQFGVAEIEEFFPSMSRGLQPDSSAGFRNEPESSASLWEFERNMIEKALAENGWNQTKAAGSLGISRHHLRYRMSKYNIRPGKASDNVAEK